LLSLGKLLDCVAQLAPMELAEDWDHVGLMVGAESWPVTKVWTALDVTESLLLAAKEAGVDGLCVHHPLIFSPLSSVTDETVAGRLALLAAQWGIGIIAAHTNLDAARGGVNDALACRLDLTGVEPLEGFPMGRVGYLKTPLPPGDWARQVGCQLETPWIRSIGPAPGHISKVAVLGGAGADAVNAAMACGADALLTGEVKYHDALDIASRGMFCLECGHDATERVVLEPWARDLQNCANALQYMIEIKATPVCTSPYGPAHREG